MARGQRDWGSYAEETVGSGMSDMAELAARLGSINVYDRRGKVIDFDDFESPATRWLFAFIGAGGVYHSDTSPHSGNGCIELDAVGAGADGGSITRYHSRLLSMRVGSEIWISSPHNDTNFSIEIAHWDGTEFVIAKLLLDFNAQTISYLDRLGVDQPFATLYPFRTWIYTYYPLKLVADFTLEEYVRVIFAGQEYDLSGIALRHAAGVDQPHIHTTFLLMRRALGGGMLYIDDYIFTMDEP